VRRTIAIAAYLCAVIAEVATLGVAEAASTEASAPTIKTSVGPMRLLSPDFGYATAYKEVWQGDTAKITLALFMYDHGR
jgi:hypothetical protein